jgi:hypothetical protein
LRSFATYPKPIIQLGIDEQRALDGPVRAPAIPVIKIGMQGAVLSVLTGALDVISQPKPVIIFRCVSDHLQNPRAESDERHSLLTGCELLALSATAPKRMPLDSVMVSQKSFWSDLVCTEAAQSPVSDQIAKDRNSLPPRLDKARELRASGKSVGLFVSDIEKTARHVISGLRR